MQIQFIILDRAEVGRYEALSRVCDQTQCKKFAVSMIPHIYEKELDKKTQKGLNQIHFNDKE